ncbi:MAG: Ig-like domain-containing protein [Thiogranum sp.]
MSYVTSAAQTLSARGIKKTILATSVSLLVGGTLAPSVQAALPSSTVLSFTLGTVATVACTYATTPPCNKAAYNITDIVGSYFVMDTNSNGVEPNEKTPIGSFNGIVIGTTQLAAGSHTGSINGSETPDIDNPWTYFGGTGMHQTTGQTTDNGDGTLTLPWSVAWNGQTNIPMAGTSPTSISCNPAACSDTSSYTIDGEFHVGGAGFTSVAYTLHLEGSVTLPGTVPTATDDAATTISGNPRIIGVTDNDLTPGNAPLVAGSVAIDTPAGNGTAADNLDDTVTYTPNPGFVGQDTFVYTVDNANGTSKTAATGGAVGAQGIVTVDVQTNVAPVAGDDPVTTNPVALDQGGGSLTVNVLANDTDANNAPGLPGGIDVATVSVTNAPGNTGTCTANANGTITYSQTLPSVVATDSCTYTVTDIDTSPATPLPSNIATVTINVESIESDWPAVLPPGVIPVLAFEPGIYTKVDGNGVPDQSVMPDKSWFSMQVSATKLIYTTLEPGPDGGFIIGYEQPATGSHTGSPDGSEQTGFTAPWVFFSNTGFDLTRNGGITNKGDGTLEFRNKYVVTWNGISTINLGGSSKKPEDLGFAIITCTPKPCGDGSTFTLEYAAHVEDVDTGGPSEEWESGFDGVPYQLYLEGTVKYLDGGLKTSDGTITTQTRLAASDVPPDTDDDATEEVEGVDLQCVGSCFDYTIDGVTPGSRVSVVLPLTGGVPNFPVWRILDNGVWRNFDTSAGDSVKTAPFIAGGSGVECPNPGDPAYIDLVNDPEDPENRPNVGHQCVQLSITDDGLNDLNKAAGIIEDPSGLGTAGAPIFVDTRSSDTSGCSIAATPVAPNRRADWWLLAGFLGWLGWNRRKHAQR